MQHAWTHSNLKQKLQSVALPAWWCDLLLKAASSAFEQPLLIGVEYFSGQAALSTASNELVGPFASYDIKYGESCNLLTDAGLLWAMLLLLRIARSGYTHFGTPCRSWIVLSRSFTQRSSYLPAGPRRSQCTDKQWHYLQEHNRLGELSAYLIKTARALGHSFTLEQPNSSLLFDFTPMSLALDSAPIIAFSMGEFGGSSPKPLRLCGTVPWLRQLRALYLARKAKVAAPAHRLAKHSATGFTGNTQDLEESSGYTEAFGIAVAMSHLGVNVQCIMEELDRRSL